MPTLFSVDYLIENRAQPSGTLTVALVSIWFNKRGEICKDKNGKNKAYDESLQAIAMEYSADIYFFNQQKAPNTQPEDINVIL